MLLAVPWTLTAQFNRENNKIVQLDTSFHFLPFQPILAICVLSTSKVTRKNYFRGTEHLDSGRRNDQIAWKIYKQIKNYQFYIFIFFSVFLKNYYSTSIYKFGLSVWVFVCLFVCLFVSNKRQNGWTDRAQIFCGTSRDYREGYEW